MSIITKLVSNSSCGGCCEEQDPELRDGLAGSDPVGIPEELSPHLRTQWGRE